jgi:plastocyanin
LGVTTVESEEEPMKRLTFGDCIRAVSFLLILLCGAGIARATIWEVSMGNDDAFHPQVLTVVQGDSVFWRNDGIHNHTSTSGSLTCVGDGIWNSGNVIPGSTWGRKFTSSGTFDYFCSIHCVLGMVGTIEVQVNSAAESRTWGQIRAIYR